MRWLRIWDPPLTGRRGLSAKATLRCALLKQYRQLSYEELAFYLLDPASFQALARLPPGLIPRRATLQANIAAIQETAWATLNTQLLNARMPPTIRKALGRVTGTGFCVTLPRLSPKV